MSKNLDFILDVVNGKVPPPGIARLLGMRITEFCNGCTTIEIDVDERLYNPMGSLHGGIYCDLADAAMGLSFFTTLAEDESYTTIDLQMTFLRPVRTGKLIAHSQIIKRGKRLGYMECELKDEKDELVGKATSTCMIILK
jgi:uncharacterized protein (TIGR00369 family)